MQLHPSHAGQFHRPDKINEPLYVITPLFNPLRFRARSKNYKNFERHVLDAGAILITIECSFGERDHVFIEEINERHKIIHVRTTHELWIKENLINIAIRHLSLICPDWKYVATIDADITFARPDWVGECLQQLQHYPVIQMFSQVAYLNPNNEIMSTCLSFMEGWTSGIPFINKHGAARNESFYLKNSRCYQYDEKCKLNWAGAPGAAWAYRREALDKLGGLIDVAILGSGDYHMATSLMGFLDISMGVSGTVDPKLYHPEYIQMLKDWQTRALKHIKKQVGHMKGAILHHWHGKMKDRGYDTRWKILIKHQYNPRTDITAATNGVYQLTDEKPQFRDDMFGYNRQRNEDSIDEK